MLGAIIGDTCGSVYEFRSQKFDDPKAVSLVEEDCFFTDDSVMSIAVAETILCKGDYATVLQKWGRKYPNAGYASMFYEWIFTENPQPYNSWGNGSAMRVSPVGWAFDTLEETLAEAKRSAECTHNHPEGIKGAQATAASIFLARNAATKAEIKDFVTKTFGYDLERTIDEIRPGYQFEVSCQKSVPESIIAFLESESFDHALQLAISLGGDADTQACIAGSIAEAFYQNAEYQNAGKGIPQELAAFVLCRLTPEIRDVIAQFQERFVNKNV